jgi:ketosteroid isomerase-like protein
MPETDIRRMAKQLRDDFNISAIAPGHCTGEAAFAELHAAFGDRYMYAGVGSVLSLADSAGGTASSAAVPPAEHAEAGFLAFLDRVDAAQLELQNGDATAYKTMWSQDDEVTISGGFGGTIEKGWSAVQRRLDWAATQFSRGTNSIERISVRVTRDLAYVAQVENIRFVVPGQSAQSTRAYRVTMVFQRGRDGWRLIHRHADSQMMQQPVRE